MKNLLLILSIFISITAYGQDTTYFSTWQKVGIITISETKIVVEYLDTDDIIIDIYSECDTISLSSSNYKKKKDSLFIFVDENDKSIESLIISDNGIFVYYREGKSEREIMFKK